MKRFMTPDEITGAVVYMGVKKANLKFYQTVILGILAGIFVGLGAHGFVNGERYENTKKLSEYLKNPNQKTNRIKVIR